MSVTDQDQMSRRHYDDARKFYGKQLVEATDKQDMDEATDLILGNFRVQVRVQSFRNSRYNKGFGIHTCTSCYQNGDLQKAWDCASLARPHNNERAKLEHGNVDRIFYGYEAEDRSLGTIIDIDVPELFKHLGEKGVVSHHVKPMGHGSKVTPFTVINCFGGSILTGVYKMPYVLSYHVVG